MSEKIVQTYEALRKKIFLLDADILENVKAVFLNQTAHVKFSRGICTQSRN